MDLTQITSTDIPHIVRGHEAAGNGDPYDDTECDLWKAAFRLHPKASALFGPRAEILTFPTKAC